MLKKFVKTTLSAVLCILMLVGCSKSVNYYDRIDTVIELSELAQVLYEDHKLAFDEKIDRNNVEQYCDKESRLYEILNSDNEFSDYYVVMINEDVVLVRVNEIFGEVEGYIVNFSEIKLGDTYKVPDELGYESNTINLISVDLYDNVYSFRAKS